MPTQKDDAIGAQIRQRQQLLEELRQQRNELLLELAANPANDDISDALDKQDAAIERIERSISRLEASRSEAGRRAAADAEAQRRKDAEANTKAAVQLLAKDYIEAAGGIDDAWRALRERIQKFNAVGTEIRALVHNGARRLADDRTWRARDPLGLVRQQHGTLATIIDLLDSREGRQFALHPHATTVAEHVSREVTRVLKEGPSA